MVECDGASGAANDRRVPRIRRGVIARAVTLHVACGRAVARARGSRRSARHRRSSSRRRAARVQSGRASGHRGQGVARSRARRAAERAVRISGAQDHRQPRAGRLCPRSPAATICRSRSAFSRQRARYRTTALAQLEFAGELALGGALRPIRGALPMALSARRDGRAFVLPAESAAEAALVRDAMVYPASSLLAVCAHLTGREPLAPLAPRPRRLRWRRPRPILPTCAARQPAKRALTIAAAGAHSLLMIGPPGTGKSMLAQRLPGLLPSLVGGRSARRRGDRLARRPVLAGALGSASLSRAAPYGERGGARRRRQRSAARRNLARAPRRAVPRRIAGMGPPRARGAARAARVRRDPHFARGAAEHLPRRLPVHRRDESLSLRLAGPRERPLPLHAGSHRPLSQPHLGPAHRSHRSRHRGAGVGRRDARDRRRVRRATSTESA